MPELDYKGGAVGAGTRIFRWIFKFYDGTPGRGTVTCPDCGWPADEMFGDHGGQCLFAKAAQNGADGDRRRRGTEGGTSSV